MAIPDNTRRLLARRLDTHRQQRWPNLNELSIRFRSDFIYLTSTDFTGDPMPLCRLTYTDNALARPLPSRQARRHRAELRGQASAAHGPNGVPVAATAARPSPRSAHRNEPDCPK